MLDADQVDNLIKFCPTKEEMDMLRVSSSSVQAHGYYVVFSVAVVD